MRHPPKKNKTLLKTAFTSPIPAPIPGQDQISYAWPSLSRYIPMTPSSSLGHTSSWASGEVGASCSTGSPSKQLMAGETQPENGGDQPRLAEWLCWSNLVSATNLLVRCCQKSEDPMYLDLHYFFINHLGIFGGNHIIDLMTPWGPIWNWSFTIGTMSPLLDEPTHPFGK